jgi:hypothetical protein
MSNRTTPRRYATLINEDTGDVISLYLHSHEAIDAEIDQRIRLDRARGHGCASQNEATRAKFHAALESQCRAMKEMPAAQG